LNYVPYLNKLILHSKYIYLIVCNENGIGLYLKLDHFKFFVKMI
jgi:hypothetical protein